MRFIIKSDVARILLLLGIRRHIVRQTFCRRSVIENPRFKLNNNAVARGASSLSLVGRSGFGVPARRSEELQKG